MNTLVYIIWYVYVVKSFICIFKLFSIYIRTVLFIIRNVTVVV